VKSRTFSTPISTPETQVALAWVATYGFDARASGDLIGM
jgi:hypothetical protein